MEHFINKSQKYHQAKLGKLEGGIFSCEDIKDSIYGIILFCLKSIKEEKIFPQLDLKNLQKQKDYFLILENIKNKHFKKINFTDKNTFLSIFMLLEFETKKIKSRGKI